ncbi:MAG: LacI family DNA-binding transcriptional regulator [Treponema sp.]|nr:LacI family DNA-binding transcriptional regulator [Treponema sp.]
MADFEKRVTQWDVARKAGVSRTQVSYVVAGSSHAMSDDVRRRILEAIDTLGYHSNKSAQKLRKGIGEYVSNLFGLVVSGPEVFSNPFCAKIIASLHSAAFEKGCKIHFIRFFEELGDTLLFNTLIHPDEIGGLILLDLDKASSGDKNGIIMEKIRSRIKNTVCVEWKNPLFPCVCFDRYKSGCVAVDHLWGKGYTSIGYVGPVDQRLSGIRDQMVKNRISVDGMIMRGAHTMSDGFDVARTLVSEGNLPSALICGSDEIAAGMLLFFNRENISVPKSVAVMGMGDSEISRFTNPPLTTMGIKIAEISQTVIDMLTGGPYDSDSILPAELIPRLST